MILPIRKRNVSEQNIVQITTSWLVHFFAMIVLVGCSNSNGLYPLVGTPPDVKDDNLIVEVENTITMRSYFNETIRKAQMDDSDQRLNASYLDLETGRTDETDSTDIFYRLDCGDKCYPRILGLDGVVIELFGDTLPNQQDCQILLKDSRRKKLRQVYDHYSCIITKEGRLGWVRYDGDFYSDLETGTIKITYWLWEEILDQK